MASCPSAAGGPGSGRGAGSPAPRRAGAGRPVPVLAVGAFWHPRNAGRGWRGPGRPPPRPDLRGPIGYRSVGPLVAHKLGRRAVDRLVDPLIGGIHAGSVDDMSTAATFLLLLAAAQRRGSLMRALRAEVPAPGPDAPPLFWALDGGMSSLVTRLGAALVARGVDVHLAHPIGALERRVPRGP